MKTSKTPFRFTLLGKLLYPFANFDKIPGVQRDIRKGEPLKDVLVLLILSPLIGLAAGLAIGFWVGQDWVRWSLLAYFFPILIKLSDDIDDGWYEAMSKVQVGLPAAIDFLFGWYLIGL